MPQLQALDELGIRRVTDKSSLQHNYLINYERLFAPFRDAAITLLEIGVFNGASLKLWEDYFPRATIVGVDIQERCRQYAGGRRIVEIASQADSNEMMAVGLKYRPTIVIDDGSHQADHILITFDALYPKLAEGGIYIVEDVAMHSGSAAKQHRGSASMSPQAFFLRIANGACCPQDGTDADRDVAASIEAVEFLQSMIVTKKKNIPEADRIERRHALVEQLDAHENWGWFAGYVLRNGGRPEEAVEAAKRAIAMAPESWEHYYQLSYALEHSGNLEGALAAVEEIARRQPNHPAFAERVRTIANRIAVASPTGD
jgi:tetratricopeptide (TPR) repeat protein